MQYPSQLLKPIAEYFRKLEKELLQRKGQLAQEDPFTDDGRFNDNASDDTEAAEQWGHARTQALSGETEAALNRVRGAMERVEKGSYGQCTKCGGMVDTERLAIDPTAELCMKCAKKISAG